MPLVYNEASAVQARVRTHTHTHTYNTHTPLDTHTHTHTHTSTTRARKHIQQHTDPTPKLDRTPAYSMTERADMCMCCRGRTCMRKTTLQICVRWSALDAKKQIGSIICVFCFPQRTPSVEGTVVPKFARGTLSPSWMLAMTEKLRNLKRAESISHVGFVQLSNNSGQHQMGHPLLRPRLRCGVRTPLRWAPLDRELPTGKI